MARSVSTVEADESLTVAALARRLGVAPATLRTWDRRYGIGPSEHCAGNHRRYSAGDVIRLTSMVRLIVAGVTPKDAAGKAGDVWVRTGAGIDIEHFLSEVVRKLLSENLGKISSPKNARPVLLACVENELHSLALLALAAVLAEARIECIFLGARTPQSALNEVITKAAPPAIFLWAQLSENADHKYVKSMPSIRPAPRVLLGGPGWKTAKIAASNKLVITEGLRDAREQIIEALAV